MPIARLSGRVRGKEDPRRKQRAKLLYRLFDAGWDIYNGNGDQVITLGNIQGKIAESDAFIFTPSPTLEDLFHAASIFVGFQTMDSELKEKPAVVMDTDESWRPMLGLIEHLHDMGTVGQHHDTFFTIVDRPKNVVSVLEERYQVRPPQHEQTEPDYKNVTGNYEFQKIPEPDFNVCVFCSASIRDKAYLQEGYGLGKAIAEQGWGCVSGAGNTGIMGEIARGSSENGGWTAGSNVPHIIELEGLPEGLSEFWPRGNIYTRMEIMIEKSDAFIVMPGGMGTMQELFALILLHEQQHDLMRGKDIIIVNRETDNGSRFWQPMLELLAPYNVSSEFTLVGSVDNIIPQLQENKK